MRSQDAEFETFIARHNARDAFARMIDLALGSRRQAGEHFDTFAGGLSAIHALYQVLAPLALEGPAVEAIAGSAPFQTGYVRIPPTPARLSTSKKWITIIEDLLLHVADPLEVNTLIRRDSDLLLAFERDWLDICFTQVLAPLGLEHSAIPWNWLVLRTAPESPEQDMGASGLWHYDNHYPATYFKVMFYLNGTDDHHSGTDILDADTSRTISDRSGYVGLTSRRISDLGTIAKASEVSRTCNFRPDGGDALLFWPARSMHRGVYPQGKPRYVISISFMPSRSLDRDRNMSLYRRLLPHMVTGSDPVPFFIEKYRHDAVNSIYVLNGPLDGVAANLILDALRPHFPTNGPADEEDSFDLIVHFCRAVAKTNTDQFLGELKGMASIILPPEMAAPVQNYIASIDRDIARYSRPETRDFAFWPNPTHPSYPRALRHLKPYARRHPILSKTTTIATAGSCFASEISAILQEREYHYLITERADDPNAGVFVDGYTPGGPVPFSASYGLIFNTPSLLQMAQRAFDVRAFKKILTRQDSWLVDPYRENVYFANHECYWADYPKHTEALKKVFTTSEIFIFTLGLNECWIYRDDGTAISRNPRGPIYPLVKHKRLSVQENVDCLAQFLEICRTYNPGLKLILTVSPIPFMATGMAETEHVVAANCHSKSVLRVAAQEMADRFPNVFYFPSYEMIMHTLDDPWEADTRHVKRTAVQQIVDVFYEMFSADSE